MPLSLGLQLWSVRDECKRDLAGTLARVGRMGYDGVELAGLHGHAAADVRRMLDDADIYCCGAHVPIEQFDDFDATVDAYRTVGCELLIVPGLPASMRDSPEACRRTAARFYAIAAKLRPLGLRAGFHLHEGDARPLSDGKSAWQHLAADTPADFVMQFDTSNAMAGGIDPVRPLLDHPGRGESVHWKAFPVDGTPVGIDGVPWALVRDACERVAGTRWVVAEHEDYTRMSPMEAAAACLVGCRMILGR